MAGTRERPAGRPDLALQVRSWLSRDKQDWQRKRSRYQDAAQAFLRLGAPLLAQDVATEGLGKWPEDVRLRQLLALALARGGATGRANRLLQELYAEGQRDEETLGLLARTHKDLWLQEVGPGAGLDHLRQAHAVYCEALRITGGYWTGINVAALAVARHDIAQARDVAGQVRADCLARLERESDATQERYWLLATLGEAALIAGEFAQAQEWYAKARAEGQGRWGDLETTRRQALLLAGLLGVDPEPFKTILRPPQVVLFVGHMADQPGRAQPRFPRGMEEAVFDEIRRRLVARGTPIGYASAACGSDILFHEALSGVGGESHVILPYDREDFIRDSVDLVPGQPWAPRCRSVLQRAAEVVTACRQRLEGGGVSYEFASEFMEGLACLRAAQTGAEMQYLAAWNGRAGDGPGGTAAIVERWRRSGRTVELVDMTAILRAEHAEPMVGQERLAPASPQAVAAPQTRVLAFMFADAVGFSQLGEAQIPAFERHFLGTVARVVEELEFRPLAMNTWGDGLFFVFETVLAAGRYALALADRIGTTDWEACGLPAGLGLRIAVHVGPVYCSTNPITGQPNYLGGNVSHAARMEPVTPPGQVYASQAFVALAAAQRTEGLAFEYVGPVLLAKGFGTFPMYIVRGQESEGDRHA